jgi:hypothetical protein
MFAQPYPRMRWYLPRDTVRAFAKHGYLPSCNQPRHTVVDVKCRLCRSRSAIIAWWPHDHTNAICPDCCEAGAEHADGETGHQLTPRHRGGDGDCCDYCGLPRESFPHDHFSEDYP